MARIYSVQMDDVTLAGATTLIQVLVPAGTISINPVRLHVGQTGTATAATQRLRIARKVSVFNTVTSFTPIAISQTNTQAAVCVGGTAATGVNASVEGAGTETVLWTPTFQVVSGFDYIWTDREQEEWMIGGAAATALVIKLPTAPASLTHWSAVLEYMEP